MPAVEITTDDLAPFAEIAADKAEAMIEDALAMATLHAPCIMSDDFAFDAAAKAIIRSAILRWNETGQGGVTSLTALGFGQSFDTRQTRRDMFTSSEIEQLKKLCTQSTAARAYEVDLTPPGAGIRSPFDYALWEAPTGIPPWDWDTPP
jgi:hypothetical protein